MLALVARRIGPYNLGAYNFANNIASFFALPLMAGVSLVGIRDMALATKERSAVVSEVQAFLLVNAVLAYAALVALAPVLATGQLAERLMPIVGLTLLFNAVGLDWVMQGLQRARPLALMRIGGQVMYAIVVVLLLEGGAAGTERYAEANAVGFGVTALCTLVYVRRVVGIRGLQGSSKALALRVIRRARGSLAAAASLVMVQLYYSSDVVIIGYQKGDHAVGEYAAAQRLPVAAAGLASLWVTVFYPHAARLARDNRRLLQAQVGQFATLALVAGMPLVPLGFLMGDQIMTGLFGYRYAAAGTAFAILLVTSAAQLLNATIGQTLLAAADDRAVLLSVTLGAFVNIVLNIALIPVLGIEGSAIATLAAEILIIGVVTARFCVTVGRVALQWRRLARAAIAISGAVGVAALTRSVLPWWLVVGVYAGACVALLLLTRAVDLRDLGRMRQI